MPPIKSKPTGRAAFDPRGQSVWEWEVASGVFSRDIGTGKFSVLSNAPELAISNIKGKAKGKATAQPDAAVAAESGDPRNQPVPRASASKEPRKSLDDLRRLSEEIKRARQLAATAAKKRP